MRSKCVPENVKRCRLAASSVLRQLRIERRIKQKDVASKLQCTRANITQHETIGVDSLTTIVSICEALDVSIVEFLSLMASCLNGCSETSDPRSHNPPETDTPCVSGERVIKAEVSIRFITG